MATYFAYYYSGRPGAGQQRVEVEAQNPDRAKDKLEAQYGKGTITSVQWAGH